MPYLLIGIVVFIIGEFTIITLLNALGFTGITMVLFGAVLPIAFFLSVLKFFWR